MKKGTLNIAHQYKSYAQKYEQKMSPEDKRRYIAYLYIGFTLFAIAFFGLFAIKPALSTIATLNKQYEDNSQIQQALEKKLVDLQRLDTQYQSLQSELPSVFTAIPRSSEIPTLTRQLETLAQTYGLAITRLTFGSIELYPGEKGENIFSFTFTITLAGDEESINNFIADLVSMNRVVSIDRVITGETDNNVFETTIVGRAYYFN